MAAMTAFCLGAQNDIDILSESGQQPHQAIARKVCQATTKQGRDLRLIDSHECCRRHLRQSAFFDDLTNAAYELGLCKLFFGCPEAEIGKNVAASRCYGDSHFASFCHCS